MTAEREGRHINRYDITHIDVPDGALDIAVATVADGSRVSAEPIGDTVRLVAMHDPSLDAGDLELTVRFALKELQAEVGPVDTLDHVLERRVRPAASAIGLLGATNFRLAIQGEPLSVLLTDSDRRLRAVAVGSSAMAPRAVSGALDRGGSAAIGTGVFAALVPSQPAPSDAGELITTWIDLIDDPAATGAVVVIRRNDDSGRNDRIG